jgi:hypothetical protein
MRALDLFCGAGGASMGLLIAAALALFIPAMSLADAYTDKRYSITQYPGWHRRFPGWKGRLDKIHNRWHVVKQCRAGFAPLFGLWIIQAILAWPHWWISALTVAAAYCAWHWPVPPEHWPVKWITKIMRRRRWQKT